MLYMNKPPSPHPHTLMDPLVIRAINFLCHRYHNNFDLEFLIYHQPISNHLGWSIDNLEG